MTTTQWDNTAPVQGLAAQYPNDKGIANHPDVYLHDSFDSNDVVDGGQYLSPTATGGHAKNYWSCDDLSPVGRQKMAVNRLLHPAFPAIKQWIMAMRSACESNMKTGLPILRVWEIMGSVLARK
ncbi:hypothetical protein [sulfur-oxidizing endosymbiont of Gigantopelta aegis]|uniref:hypothetical protein n=1 Tax=sulfur-oxidizing endosymbiont of Gigantopelta aegis TaxID=2794934 RepID=UPI0018DB8EF7|nr:hypothetical protein [sulfur-oxidizing endosymbiont of Gigantopelta aegis]